MAGSINNMKNVVKHLANSSLSDLCLICLTPLKDNSFESLFTLICKEERNYCVADALEAVCQFQFDGTENYNVCMECFQSASAAYKLHLQAKQSMEIITSYVDELINNINNVSVTNEDAEKLLCIPLSNYEPQTPLFDFSLEGIGKKVIENDYSECYNVNTKDSDVIMVVEDERTSFFKLHSDGTLNAMESDNDEDEETVMTLEGKKSRKKRDPMVYISCSRCPIKYRFISKLKGHMKKAHDIEIFCCKICKMITEHKEEYEEHLKTHRGRYQCSICNAVYKKSHNLVSHMKVHRHGNNDKQSETANICEMCGAMLRDEKSLAEHVASKHVKKYTCYYCGRMYKGESSFESHIKKHEIVFKKNNGTKSEQAGMKKKSPEKADPSSKGKRAVCLTCGKDFVDERALMWHQRLHNNVRPYTCDTCGRGFVSKNRRNQHAVCTHTQPARRCPLCPALFHLRSMVNTHVKKVHLKKTPKRRNRTTKHKNVFWRTEAVPIQELSVDVQHDVLELQNKESHATEGMESALSLEKIKAESQSAEYVNQLAKYENEPVEYENEPVEYENEPVEYENEPVEYENQPAEYENQPVEDVQERSFVLYIENF